MELNANYQELHNLAKHIIHLSEGSSAILCSLESLLLAHARRFPDSVPVHDAVEYQRSLFQSTNLRLQSLSKKVENTINLTYHIVAQQDNKLANEMNEIILSDSTSMSVIATLTMLFLPGTAIAVSPSPITPRDRVWNRGLIVRRRCSEVTSSGPLMAALL